MVLPSVRSPKSEATPLKGYTLFLPYNPTVIISPIPLPPKMRLILGLSSPSAPLLVFQVLISHMNYCNNFLIGPHTYIHLFYYPHGHQTDLSTKVIKTMSFFCLKIMVSHWLQEGKKMLRPPCDMQTRLPDHPHLLSTLPHYLQPC